ncbi:MAG: hypothetical protein IPL63_01175 [Saprospiraceae bacterium]|nr:hypothetical protein [Saprospiraceae bacterium]MBK6565285.1 hypothetical protein [Saprospiraceae bacterium]MBK6786015.1 hypothetical protein [Saprospiraceae bacterium]MBK7525923.1 hypothetical protein [Saprospiraceae bacterium]MBK8080148.1 hypothetical protein [Saprospiraceae bacterium]
MKLFPLHLISILLLTFISCSNSQKSSDNHQASKPLSGEKNFLTMKIDGKEWSADREIFGSYHFNESLGPGLINIAGVKGDPPNDQPFNINLYNTKGPGLYKVNIGQGSSVKMYENVSQLAQFTPSNYLCGGAQQGSQMNITIIKVSKDPQMVEATFSGTMTCVEGNTLTITEGKFYYHENND